MDDKKDMEVVSGDGSNLNISPVYDHINISKPTSDNKPTHVVIPKETKKEHEDDKEEDKKNEEDKN